jgi:hypothetical protein
MLIIWNVKITGYYNVVWGLNIILFNCVYGFLIDAVVTVTT